MRISIAISALILVAAGNFHFKEGKRLMKEREMYTRLGAEAAALGIFINHEDPNANVLVTRRRAREDTAAEGRAAAKELIGFAVETMTKEGHGRNQDEEMQKRLVDIMDLMLSLDAAKLKIVIAEFRASTEMDDVMKNGMITFTIMTLADDHPEEALLIFTESSELMGSGIMETHVLASSLAKWASTDPDGALEWVRANRIKHPDLITDDVKAGLVKGAASMDMRLGFNLIAEFKMDDPSDALMSIAVGIKTAGERTGFLELFREYEKGHGGDSDATALKVRLQ